MALLGTVGGLIRDPTTNRKQVSVGTFTHVPDVNFNFGSLGLFIRSPGGTTTIEEVIVYTAPPPSNEVVGDYATQLFLDATIDNNLGRHTKYMVGSNVRTVLKDYWIQNNSSGSRTVDVWVAGLHKQYVLAAGAEAAVEVWRVLYPADLIEMQTSADNVSTLWSGVEIVSEAA